MSFSDYLEAAILNHFFRNSATSPPATVYAALYTVAPGDAGPGTEVSGGSYARVAVAFGAPSGGVIANPAQVAFPTASAPWGTIVAVAILDAATSGNLLADVTPSGGSFGIGTGQRPVFDIGQLTVTQT